MLRRVLVFGTFDGLHLGHESLLKQASALGDRLTVIVARDATVQQVKGHPALHNETERLRALQAHPLVHEALLGSLGDKYAVILQSKPHVIALGYDQEAFTEGIAEYLLAHGLDATIVRLAAFEPHRYKSSLLNSTGHSR